MIFIERRKHRREQTNETVDFIKITDKKEVINRGIAIDKSSSGVGLQTGFQLIKGQPVIFRLETDNGILRYGIVCWSNRENGFYRSGIRYIFNNT